MKSWMKYLAASVGAVVLPLLIATVAMSVVVEQTGIAGKQVYSYDQATGFARMQVVIDDILVRLGGEHVDPDETLGYLRTVGGMARTFAIITDSIIDGSSATTTLPAGGKTFFSKIVGSAGAQSATITVYGDYKSTATEEFSICTMSLSGTSEDAKKCTGISEDYKYYHAKIASIAGTDATINVWAEVGLGGGAGSGGDASAANQTTIIGHVDGLEGGIGAAADAAATAGSTGSLSAKLRLMTTQLNSILASTGFIFAGSTGGANSLAYISAGATEDEHAVCTSACNLYSISATNINAAVRYLKCENDTAAGTAPGTDTPELRFAIPGATTGGGTNPTLPPSGLFFSTGLTCWLVTGAADSDVAEVAANEIMVNYGYK